MKKIYSIDRFEGEYAVICDDDGNAFEIKREQISAFSERDVFSAEMKNGSLFDITPLPEERERRLEAARRRLDRFKKGSNS